ncbi:elongation factor P--(R)-beta-lysine ligase [Buchnera aphidicola]|uniref:elongation factor P--(R)-beta-lysine ligase n=1 Tax=Buchnera aphidicola TaxID=9 RepID=UPI0030EE0C37
MKNKKISWKPTSKVKDLVKRSKIFFKIRKFFYKKNFIELDTPLLSQFQVNEYYLDQFKTKFFLNDNKKKNSFNKNYWLNTSPEYHMKRFLSYDKKNNSIYQICKSFRNNECGTLHNPEFTILEWYRPNYNIYDLMKEINEFLIIVFKFPQSVRYSYKKIFQKYLDIDPLTCKKKYLKNKIIELKHCHLIKDNFLNKNDLLEILFMIGIEPYLGKKFPIFIYNYPSDQALMSKINKKNKKVCERFELFFKGIELGNGFYELSNYVEQKERFLKNNIKRKKNNIKERKIDNFFLCSLKTKNFPKCSGVALGLDRLIMLFLKKTNIKNVLSFSIENC